MEPCHNEGLSANRNCPEKAQSNLSWLPPVLSNNLYLKASFFSGPVYGKYE